MVISRKAEKAIPAGTLARITKIVVDNRLRSCVHGKFRIEGDTLVVELHRGELRTENGLVLPCGPV